MTSCYMTDGQLKTPIGLENIKPDEGRESLIQKKNS